jgi:Xaa-Pro dipeptidase
VLDGKRRIAMEYSPNGRLPYIGLVDAGTVELVRSFGVEVVSSADLVASFQARLSPEQMASHRIAARNLVEIKDKAFEFIAESLKGGGAISEFDVCEFVRARFREYDMTADVGPICAVDAHAGDPHYEPTAEKSAGLSHGQLVLLDLWAKIEGENSVYGDITWMAFAGSSDEIPQKYADIFDVIVRARDAAVKFVRDNLGSRPVHGYEVDDVCRREVEHAGYGKHFTHRTGHSITTSEHGAGPNIDNLETEDRRKLQQGHLFSIEPGIYMEQCGFRTEIDVLVNHEGAEVTTLPLQTEIHPLL